ncbi:MAG: tRNA glutamyl-Q(34) synthetase GluQRS [Gammaproteobacteria bacterium]|nr:tRNA glutamyl-Q(34) synthetase GluQRS [Gammaproteobacteria bacterium]
MPSNQHFTTAVKSVPYRGRFAPSPTGPLHFGSLVTALGSYLQARSQQGEWLLRMENIDPPREQAGAADAILRALDAYHLYWDGAVLYQSTRHEAYEAALMQLARNHDSFACGCSRKTIAARGGSHVYPGTCRDGLSPGEVPRTIRVRVPNRCETFIDTLQGPVKSNLQTDTGDFVVRRADGLYAYHLTVVVDDAAQGITDIVRGTDLLGSTPPQRYLQQCFGYPHPQYSHLPLAVNQQGQKLSKQNCATAIDIRHPGLTLCKALRFLGHPAPAGLQGADPARLLAWATANWDIKNVPRTAVICVNAENK